VKYQWLQGQMTINCLSRINFEFDCNMNPSILLIDDDVSVLDPLQQVIADLGFSTKAVVDPFEGLEIVKASEPAVVITDIKMPGLDGLEVLKRIKDMNAHTQVVVISGHGTIDDAVTAMKRGAYDYISKPFDVSEIENVVLRALEKASLLDENLRLRESLEASRHPGLVESHNPAFRELLESASQAAASMATILVQGESGTGKEVLARYIAARSRRADKPLVTVNCAAIPESLMESELFGHKKGAFTGAHQDRKGRFEEAHGGTLFLDEIGELPASLQAKLLRVLQEGEIAPVGGSPKSVDVRIMAATNKNLRKLVAAGEFREDLFYRLNVITLELPPLRHRMEDVNGLTAYFLAKYGARNDRGQISMSEEALGLLHQYAWPGNVRELENAVERAVILSTGNLITPKSLPPELSGDTSSTSDLNFKRGMKLEEIELMVIQSVLRYNHGDRARSAAELGIGVRTLYRKLNHMMDLDGIA
jgi:two-component system response regulator HydG